MQAESELRRYLSTPLAVKQIFERNTTLYISYRQPRYRARNPCKGHDPYVDELELTRPAIVRCYGKWRRADGAVLYAGGS
jgi:hypothetical protein